jgi:ParB-like chromosome segregation protein Spo0J
VARQLALAHALQQRIDSGEFRNQAELAGALGFSRERISRILDLLLLAPNIQEEILLVEGAPGKQPLAEPDLHAVLQSVLWPEQRESLAALRLRGW